MGFLRLCCPHSILPYGGFPLILQAQACFKDLRRPLLWVCRPESVLSDGSSPLILQARACFKPSQCNLFRFAAQILPCLVKVFPPDFVSSSLSQDISRLLLWGCRPDFILSGGGSPPIVSLSQNIPGPFLGVCRPVFSLPDEDFLARFCELELISRPLNAVSLDFLPRFYST